MAEVSFKVGIQEEEEIIEVTAPAKNARVVQNYPNSLSTAKNRIIHIATIKYKQYRYS